MKPFDNKEQYERCRKLWAAKMVVMINDYLTLEAHKRRVRKTKIISTEQINNGEAAKVWVTDEDNFKIGSLNWVCDQLNINPSKVRRNLYTNWRNIYFAMKFQRGKMEARRKRNS